MDSTNGAGSFTWTPTFAQAGAYNVTFIASDGSLADSEVVAITVNNVNRAPVLNAIGAKSVSENQLLQFRVSSTDPDGTVPTLSALNSPSGATFVDSLNGAGSFVWTPSFTQAGTYNVTFIASDGSLADSEVVAITVNNVNRAPVLNAIGAKSVNENQLLQFRVSATDPDLTTPTLSAVNLPAGAAFVDSANGAGSFSWTPSFAQAGTHNVTFIAGDGSLADSEVVAITVNNVNRAPVLNPIGNKIANENQPLSFRISALDPDGTVPAFSALNLPTGAVLTDSLNGAGSFVWTPSFTQAGTYNVTFIASDGALADSEAITITVNNVNRAPVLAAIGSKTTGENQPLQFRVSASDPDLTTPVLSANNLPSGAVFTDSLNGAGSFSWTPSFTQAGSYNVRFIASDGSLADSEMVNITVGNINAPPVLAPIGAKSTNENLLLSFRISASDVDGTTPSFLALNVPSGAIFTDSLNGAGSFRWTPSFTQAGTYNVTFIASDGLLADSEVVTVTVNDVGNQRPVLAPIGSKTTNENQLLQFRVSATDAESDPLTLTAVGLPTGSVFVDSSNGAGSFTWTPSFAQAGTYNVTFIASDASLADSEVVTITVNNVNRPPVLNAIGNKSTNENQLLSFRISATDPDGTTPSLSALNVPSGATFVDSLNGAGSFNWTPSFAQAGTYLVTFIASDGTLADSEVVTITVNNVNRVPVLNAIGAKSVNENQLLSFRVSSSDPDGTTPALSAVNSPSGAVFVDSTNGAGSFTWTPSFAQAGTHNVTFIASDGSLADSEVVTITVNNVNRAPVLNAIGAKSVNENQLLSFRVSSTDPDGTVPNLSALNVPSGATFVDSLNGAGSFNWTPSFTQAGTYNLTFIASDGSLADSEVVTITVNNTNRAPVLAPIGAKSTPENQLLQFRVSATDPDGTVLTLSTLNIPSGATFVDSANGAGSFSWTPTFFQSGTYNVTFIASDGALADSEIVAITVGNANRAPVLAPIGAKSTNESQLLSFRISASDPDLTTPTLSAIGLPSGSSFVDSLNGAGSFNWTPNFFQSGSYNVTFIASDGSLADSETVTITVNNVNRAPILAGIGNKVVNENQQLAFNVSASDPDLTVSALSVVGLPSGATFVDSLNGTGRFTWMPSFIQSGNYNVRFIASDGSLADSELIIVTVNNVNAPPVLAAIGSKLVTENQLLSFRISASDVDGTNPNFTALNVPSGAIFTDSLNGAGSFRWTPSFTQAGTYNVTFIASDGTLADSEVVTITVNESGNQAPVLAPIGAKSTNENQQLAFNISASDADLTTPSLSALNLPAGAAFVDSLNGRGRFTWTPSFTQAGTYNVTFIASDGTLADSEAVTITVNNVNRAPVLNVIGNKSTNENQLLSFGVSSTDPDGTTPALSALNVPSGAAFVDSLNSAGSFSWTPSFTQADTYLVTFVAGDGTLADSEVVTITVNNVNRAPVLNTIGAKSVNESQLLQFRVSSTDPDGTIPTLSAAGLPSGASFVDSTNGAGSFTWTPSFAQAGTHNVTFIASDGSLADSEVVSITVNNVNRAPVLNAIGAKSVNENQLLQFRISASDPDGTTPTLSTIGLPSGATFVDSLNGAGSFNWTPSFTQAGTYNVTFIASDGSLADSEVVTITVNNTNRAPVLVTIGAKSVNENQLLQFRVSATDPDGTVLTLSALNIPSGATFVDSANGAGSFSWTPTFFQSGTYNVTFIASDGTLADSEVVAITVGNANRAPVLAPIGAKSINESQLLQFRISASDPDLTTPSLVALNVPSGAVFTDSLNGASSFVWTPNFFQSGSYNVTFIASDGALADSEMVTITVNNVNRPPVLAGIGNRSINENQQLAFNVSASDPDGTVPALSAAPLPSGAVFVDSLNGRGRFTWTPSFTQSGAYNVTFIASDGSLADSEVIVISVNNVNAPPVLAAIGNKLVTENQLLSFRVSASDVDGTNPNFTALNLPSGAIFTDSLNGAGSFRWTPSFTQAGTYNVTFIASDGLLSDSEVVTITVNESGNQAPVLAPIGAKSTNENQQLAFNISATDADLTTPSLSAVNLPSGATLVDSLNGRGRFTWTPSFTQSGTYNVTFIASDGTLADSEVVTITVNNVNRAPVLNVIGAKSTNENQLLQFRISSSDPDGTIPTHSALSLPSGAVFVDSLNGAGSFTWTPSFTQAGTYNVTFIASDGSLADSEVVTITVNNVNRPPVLATIGAKSTNENLLLQFRISATDPDLTTPSFSAVGLPTGATLVDSLNGAGSFRWTPTFFQSGVYNVTIIATDGTLADSEVVIITVNNVNRPPVLATIGSKTTSENQLLQFRISATDPDLTTPTLSAVGLPAGAVLVDSLNGAGSFSWTPTFAQSGSYNVTFITSDGSLADSELVPITVNNVNRAPILAAIGAKNVSENQLLQFRVSASDPDATIPSLSTVGLPSGAAFVDSANGAGSFSWTPTFFQSGTYNVTFIASDGALADSEVVAITVGNANRAPVLAAIGSKSISENQLLQFRISASDPDLTTPSLAAVNVPSGAVFTDSLNGAGSFRWTPTFFQSGTYNVTFIASDGALADSEVVVVTVNNVNRPPVLAGIGNKSVNENQLLAFNVSAADPDLTTPVLTATPLPAGAVFVDSLNGRGGFVWTPSFTQSGAYNVRFIASDGSLADSEVIVISVNNVNAPPVLAAIGAKAVTENQLLSFRISASDVDGTIPGLSAVGVPSGATFVDSANGAGSFRWTPTFTQAGAYNVIFIATDGVLADSEVVTITVNESGNQRPVLAQIGAKVTDENQLLAFNISATDADLTTPALLAVGLPTGATMVDSLNGRGRFSWTPTFFQAGSYSVTFIASDGSLADSEVVAITVNNINRPPVLNAIGNKTTNENQLLQFRVSSADPDLTAPVLSTVGLPSGAVFVDSANGAGSFSWTPSFAQAGSYNVTFIASDGSMADSELVAVLVNNVNRAPILNAIGSKVTNENQLLQFRVSATDPDGTVPALSAVNLPAGSVFTDSLNGAGSFGWTPSFTQSGIYNVTFIATDGSLADSEIVTITVNEGGNQRPVLDPIGAKTGAENSLLQFRITSSDPDGTTPTLSSINRPSGSTFVDSANGRGSFSWTPTFTQAGTYNVTFIAADGLLADSEVVTITINNTNRAPVLAPIGNRSITEGNTLAFNTSATDADGQPITMSAVNVPVNAVYVDSGNGRGRFTFSPNFIQAGSYNVTFIASDGGLADSELVVITVFEAGNQAPVLAPIGAKSVLENQNLTFGVSASDADSTIPAYIVQNVPLNASFTDSGNGRGSFTFNPDFFQAGTYNVRFIATDGSKSDTELVAITVNNVNRKPVWSPIGNRVTTEGQLLAFNVSASDPDLTIPALSLVGLPSGASFVDSLNGRGRFSWTPTFTQSGAYNLRFLASDGDLIDTQNVTVTVNEGGNQRPVLAPIGAKSTNENQLLSFTINATDADATIPVLSAVSLPSGAVFVDSANGRGSFSWTPTFFQAGGYNVTFVASDGALADSEVVSITVNNVNRPPVLAAIGSKNSNENQLLQFRVSAADPDLTTPSLSAVGLPSGAAFIDSLNGAGSFAWTPSFVQSGAYNVTFIALDGTLADSEVVIITVNNVNRPPVLAAIGAKSVSENQLLQFRLSANDPDLTIPAFTVVGLPTGAVFVDSLTGAASFGWTPSFFQSGNYSVTFIASDGSLADSEVVAITVNEVNRSPVLASIGNKSVNENQLLRFRISASDPDLTVPILSAAGLPTGSTLVDSLNGAGSFSWTPAFTQSGSYNVTFIASDGSLADSEQITITVNNVNAPPVLAAIGAKTMNENQLLQFRTSASDVDGTIPVLSALNVPSGAVFVDSANGAGFFRWTPSFVQSGIYNVTFIASDGLLADSELVTITVNESGNQRPVLAPIGAKTVDENQPLAFNISATDPDLTIPALSAVGQPTGATFVDSLNGRGRFAWTPTFFQSGSYNVTFIASDGALADSEVVAITVNNINRAPVLAAIGNKTVNEGQLLQFRISSSDPDLMAPVLTTVGLPTGAVFVDSTNGAGSFTWTPSFFQSGSYNATFIASDGSLADSETIAITVNNVNRPPVLATIGSKTVTESQLLQFRVVGTDPDLTVPVLSAVGLPTGAAFVDSLNGAGSFAWTPTFFQSGSYNVTFIASDGTLADSEAIAITVNDAGRAPVLALIGNKTVNENQLLQFRISATDPDLTMPILSVAGLPTGAAFMDSLNGAGSFAWTPTFFQSGSYNVTFIASDGSLADSEIVAITVNNVNRAPVLNGIGAKTVNENQLLQFGVSSSDPDLTAPVLSAIGLPSGANFVDSTNGAGSFSWTPSFTQAGAYNVTFIASDGSLADSEVVTITVNNVNRPPVLNTIGVKAVNENQLLQFRVSAVDPDATIPALSALSLPTGAVFSDSLNGAGSFNWTPSFVQSGGYNVTFIASDGNLADSEIVAITVNEVGNQRPVLDPIGAKVGAENALLQFRITSSDADGTLPALAAVGLPSGAVFIDSLNSRGAFTWTPSFVQAGAYNVTFIASDGLLADSEAVTITINNTNRSPVLDPIGPRTVLEGNTMAFVVTASDPDLQTPALSAVNRPANSTFADSGNGSGIFNFTPSFAQAGVYNVTFIASDANLADSEIVAITVVEVGNQRPAVDSIGPKTVAEAGSLQFRVRAVDPDGTVPALAVLNRPTNAVFIDSGNGRGSFTFNPNFTQAGLYNVSFVASDGTFADTELVAITVTNTNRLPVLDSIRAKAVTEGQLLSFRISSSDPDGQLPAIFAENLPAGAAVVDSANGRGSFAWTPAFTQAGVYNVRFIASDGDLADSELISITVNEAGNQRPVLATIGSKVVDENQLLQFRISGNDPDGTLPVLSTLGLPSGAAFVDSTNGAGAFSWTPSFVQAGSYNVTFIASDGTLADSEAVSITVNNVNRAPVLAAIGAKNVNENQLLLFRVSAADPDLTTPSLSAVGLPAGAAFVDSLNGAGSFGWTPSFAQAGSYNLTFIASDGTLADSELVVITVGEVNRAPVLAAIGAKTVNENQLLQFRVSASDSDLTTPTLAAVGLPAGALFVDSTNGAGSFAWTPDFFQSGSYSVTFIASDGTLADSETVAISVINVNRAPILAPIGGQTIMEGQLLQFRISASDLDLAVPVLTALNLPVGATFVDSTNGAGAFAWMPDFTQAGSYNVTFISSDGLLADSEVVSITVNEFDRAPVLAPIGARITSEDQLLQFRVSATDPDLTVPVLSAVGLPAGATFVDSANGAGAFVWTPVFNQGGTYNVTFIATAGLLADSEVVTITVNVVNRRPVLAAIGPKQTTEVQSLAFVISASDSNGTIPQLSAVGLPAGASFVDSLNGKGLFSWTPTALQSGAYNVTFVASDSVLADSEVVAITVLEAGNLAPVFDSIPSPIVLNEGDSLFLRLHATDPEGDIPLLGSSGRPFNSSFVDSGNGSALFVFRPTFLQAGNYTVTFIATDRANPPASAFRTVGLAVRDVNRPPVVDSISNKTVLAGQTLRFRVHAKDTTDAVPGPIFLTTSPLPPNASFVDSGNAAGGFTFTPDFSQIGVHTITFIATDSDTPSLSGTRIVQISVQNTNRSPVWISTFGPQMVREGDSLRLTVIAADPDSTLLTLTTGPLPANATFVDNRNNTGTFRFLPSFIQGGLYSVRFNATDGLASIQQTVFIQVTEAGNQRPSVYAPDSLGVTEAGTLVVPILGDDPDSTKPALFALNLPANATFTDSGNGVGIFRFLPSYIQSGTHFIQFVAADGSLADTATTRVVVLDAGNQPPVLAAIPNPPAFNEGDSLKIIVRVSDLDTTKSFLRARPLPAGAAFVDSRADSGIFVFRPSFFQAGSYSIRFVALDARDTTVADSQTVAVTVLNVDRLPYFDVFPGGRTVAEGETLRVYVHAIDPDSTIPHIELRPVTDAPGIITSGIDGQGGINVTYVPAYNAAGGQPFRVLPRWTFRTADLTLSPPYILDQDLQVTVTNVERPPVLAPIGPRSVAEGSTLTFDISALDPDSTVPAVSAQNLPAGASFAPLGGGRGRFSWAPGFNQAGSYQVRFIAQDGTARADSELVTITVTEFGNHPPAMTITILDTLVLVNRTLTLEFSAADADLTTPVLNVLNRPRNSTFTDFGNGIGRFEFTPDSAQTAVGSAISGRDSVYTITLTAFDGAITVSQTVRLRVYNWRLADLNRDEEITPSDVVQMLQAVFNNTNLPSPLALGDLNCDGFLSPTDAVLMLNAAFAGTPLQPCQPPPNNPTALGR
ncbi:MAG TPA: Ig-like domain-containing protein [Verrucomicrobiae bacterium]|nr:Ig-like domain-containing protein [Verrucomicrobiae bacterium]